MMLHSEVERYAHSWVTTEREIFALGVLEHVSDWYCLEWVWGRLGLCCGARGRRAKRVLRFIQLQTLEY